MDETLKIFIGTNAYMKKAEIAIEFSIRNTTTGPFEIIWLDPSRNENLKGWKLENDSDYNRYRFAIPELLNFTGRALALNTTMIVRKDLRELFELPMKTPTMAPPNSPVVMLFDCSSFKDLSWWPNLKEMKESNWKASSYYRLLNDHKALSPRMPPKWYCPEGSHFNPDKTALVDFALPQIQPWHPYSESHTYSPHPRPDMVELWWQSYRQGLQEKGIGEPPCAVCGDPE